MSFPGDDIFLGEIRIMSFVFPPQGWALCNGQFMAINQNQALFSLLGTMYGGNGQTTFALPNLQTQVPMHRGNGHVQGEQAGQTAHTLVTQELPVHTHVLTGADNPATTNVPTGNYLGQRANVYAPGSNLTALAASEISNVGGGQAHVNQQPYLTLSYCIAIQGIFPSQN